MTLTDFLLARIAEDERRVEFVRGFIPDEGDQGEYINPARVLAECEAKRRIVEMATRLEYQDMASPMVDILLTLASVYADHPDYREEWRP